MQSIKTIAGDVTERAASTGWQVAAGWAIAANVFHDPTLTPLVAAALSVAKQAAVWFYVQHKGRVDTSVGAVVQAGIELRPIVEQIIADIQASAAAQPADAEQPGGLAVTPNPAPASAIEPEPEPVNLPPFMQHASQ